MLTILLARAWIRQHNREVWYNRSFLLAFIISMLFGIALELIQLYLIKDRKAEVLDVLANMGGSLFAYPVHRLFRGGGLA